MIYSTAVRMIREFFFYRRTALVMMRTKNAEIDVLQKCILAHQHALHDLAVAFRVALDQPEVDIREDLDQMISEMADNLCQAQEFVL